MKRTLVLRRESLTDLSDRDLAGLNAGQREATGQGITCPLVTCASRLITCDRCI